MRKTTDQIKEDWLEDVEYGTLAPTVETFDEDDFQEKLKDFNDAQSVKKMSETAGWVVLKRELIAESTRRAEELLHCNDENEEKLKKLKRNQQKADHARDYIIDLVENAKDVPQPVRVDSQQ